MNMASFFKGADSLYRDSFTFSDEKLNSPTDSTPALLSSTVTPRKGDLPGLLFCSFIPTPDPPLGLPFAAYKANR